MNQRRYQKRKWFGVWTAVLVCGCQAGNSPHSFDTPRIPSWARSHVQQTTPLIAQRPLRDDQHPLELTPTESETWKPERLTAADSSLAGGRTDLAVPSLSVGESATSDTITTVANFDELPLEMLNESSELLNNLIRLAIARNPEIAIVQHELEMACARIPQVGSLEDPMLDVLAWPIFPNVPQTAAGRMTADIAVSQTVPWRGKLQARVAEVSREVSGWQNRLLAAEFRIANEVKRAYFDHALASERSDVIHEELEFIDELYQRTERLYQTGRVGQQDLLRLKAERGMIEAELVRWQQDRIEAQAELLRLLQTDEMATVDIRSYLPETLEIVFNTEQSLQRALAISPELQALWADVQRDQWRVQQSRLDYYPDLTFMVGWGGMTTRRALAPFADGIDNINTGVSLNLPVRKAARQAALRESQSRVAQSVRQLELGQSDIARDVRQIHAQLDSQQSQLELLNETVIPQFMDAIEISLVAYEANQSDLTELITLRREVLRLKLIEKEIRSRWHQTKGDLYLVTAEVDW